MRRTVPPSAEIEDQIDQLLAVGVGENPRESLSSLAKLGARLIIQRAVEDEFDAWLGRARYDRRPDYQRGLRTISQGCATAFARASCRPPRASSQWRSRRSERQPSRSSQSSSRRGAKLLRTEPLKAMVIGAFVRGLSMRDIESLCEKAGLGKLSKSTASRICEELRERFEAVQAPRPLRGPPGRAVPRRGLPVGQAQWAQGGRPCRLGLHRGGRARAFVGDAGDARVPRGLARPGARSDRPRARRAAA